MQSLNKTTAFKRSALALAMGISSLSLVACGGGDDYKAQSCVGQASDNPNDCRHFDQNHQDTPVTPTNPTKPTEPRKPDTGSTTQENQWQDFNYNADDVSALTLGNSISLDKYHKDEKFVDLAISGDTAVVASYYHNRLRSFLLTDGVATKQSEMDFARVAGGQDDVDAVSGATEQTLKDIEINKQGSDLVVVGKVEPYKPNRPKAGVGLYVSQDNNGGLKNINYASSNSAEFLSLPKISAQALSKNGQTIAVADKSKLMLLNAHNLQSQKEIETDFSISSIAFSDDGQWIYAGGIKAINLFSGKAILAVFKASDLSKVGEVVDENINDYQGIWVVGKQQIIAQPVASKSLVMIQWQDDGSAIKQKRNIQMPNSISAVAVTNYQGKPYLAMTDSNKRLNIVELQTGKRAELTLKAPSNSVAFDQQGYAWVLMGNNLTSVSMKNF